MIVDFKKHGVNSLEKKLKKYQDSGKVIFDAMAKLKNKVIDNEQFLEQCAKSMINEKYYEIIKEQSSV